MQWMRNKKLCAPPLSTFKDVVITQDSIKARLAFANEAVDIVPADGPVPARLTGTFIHLDLTMLAFKTRAAFAREASHDIHAGAPVQTGV